MSVRRSLIASVSLAIVLLTPGVALAGDPVADFTPPVITLTTPPDGAFYTLNQIVNADFSCTDDAPGDTGIATCLGESGTVPDGAPIDTDDLGQHLFHVTATDNQGNPSSRTHLYTVLAPVEGKPDVRIRRIGRSNIVGNNIYSPSAAGEGIAAKAKKPSVRRFVISIQNDGTQPDSYTVVANGTAVSGFDVSYARGYPPSDITTPLVTGIYQTPTIQPGELYRFRAIVRVGTVLDQPGISRLITARSNNDTSVSDSVRFTIGNPPPVCVTAC